MDGRSASTVSILGGTGALGFGLALRLARQGVAVIVGSRSAERAGEAAVRAVQILPHGSVTGMSNEDAARASEIVVLTVPFASHAETIQSIGSELRDGQILIDTTVPLATAVGGRPTTTVGVWHGSAAQQARALAPDGVGVVSALHSVSAASLTEIERALDEDVLICGDRREDKRRVSALIERIPGLRCVDCGALELSRFTEQFTPVLISVNRRYKTHAGLRVLGLP